MTPLERITARVTKRGLPGEPGVPVPLLSVEEFFDGNDVTGSIGCNLTGAPEPVEFYDLLTTIADRPDVKDVRVEISMFDDPAWPFSERILIMTSARPDEVAGWFPERLKPDETGIGEIGSQYEPYDVPANCHVVWCWWD